MFDKLFEWYKVGRGFNPWFFPVYLALSTVSFYGYRRHLHKEIRGFEWKPSTVPKFLLGLLLFSHWTHVLKVFVWGTGRQVLCFLSPGVTPAVVENSLYVVHSLVMALANVELVKYIGVIFGLEIKKYYPAHSIS